MRKTYKYTCMYTSTHACIQVHMHVYKYTCMYTSTDTVIIKCIHSLLSNSNISGLLMTKQTCIHWTNVTHICELSVLGTHVYKWVSDECKFDSEIKVSESEPGPC